MREKIGDQQIAFLEFELTQGDAKTKKSALQNLAALYRRGSYLPQDKLGAIEGRINALLLVIGQDRKVVRWGLNALAQCGRWTNCQHYIETALSLYKGDPEIEAAGVAALCRLLRGHTDEIEALRQIDPKLWKLAALQTRDVKDIDLNGLRIDIGRDDKEILKLSLIIIGVNRDIEHLFHPRHSNGTFVKELCSHEDIIVQQYSVWAVTENSKLSLADLGLSFSEVGRLSPNVQSKMYQLAAQRHPDMRLRLDLIAEGSSSRNEEAREGVSKGIRDHYFDGLEEIVVPWIGQETSKGIRGILIEHVARNSDKCGPYRDLSLQIFEDEPGARSRLLLGAEGKPLYRELKASQDRDLLSFIVNPKDLAEMVRAAQVTKIKPKKTVCMLMASPRGEKHLRLDEEVRDALQKVKLVKEPEVTIEIISEWAVRLSDVTDHLLNAKPQIVHFSGHGGGGNIFVENALGKAQPLSADGLAGLIGAVGNIECVVLNACYTDDMSSAVKKHVKVVIGCDGTIDDKAAIIFTNSFYRTLSHGRSFEESFKMATADVLAQIGASEANKYKIYL
jgi:hypothetical protein